MGGLGNCCCSCCKPFELPDETWEIPYEYRCCIQKTVDVDPDDTWHYLCSDVIRECTQTQSADLRIYRHMYPVVYYDYLDEPDPIACIIGGDCTIEGEIIPHCTDEHEECGLLSIYGSATTKQRLVIKYKHLRDVVTITKLKATCEPEDIEACKYMIVYQKVFDVYYGQVSFGSSTKTVSSVTGCCKVTSSSTSVSELTCTQAADALTTHMELTLSRSQLFDEIPASIVFAKGDMVVCDAFPAVICILPDADGPILCSIDSPIFTYPDAVCGCDTIEGRCYAILVGTNTSTGDFGCLITEAYASERITISICTAYTPGGITLLPGYSITYDDTYCYVECDTRVANSTSGYDCPPNPVCRTADGFISKVECENLSSSTSCSEYSPQCLDIATEDWTFDIL